MSAPDAAADELDRTMREHGFLGAVINGHSQGRYFDDPFFDAVFTSRSDPEGPDLFAPNHPAAGPLSNPVTRGSPTR